MNRIPCDLHNFIIDFITPDIKYEKKFIDKLNIQKEEYKNIILISKLLKLGDIDMIKYSNLKTIIELLKKYNCYQYDHEMYLKYQGLVVNKSIVIPDINCNSPILIDMLFSGCNLPYADSSLENYQSFIFDDIKRVISIMPSSLNSYYGRLRCRYNVSPLYAACVNKNIPIHVIKFLLEKGSNLENFILLNGSNVKIIDDLVDNISAHRLNEIKKLI